MSESSIPGIVAQAGGWDQALAQHEGLVRWVVRQQRRGALPFADALHAGRIGLWHALRRYDPARGTRFGTYAVATIAYAVREAVAQARPAAPPARPAGAPPDVTGEDLAEQLHQAEVRDALQALVQQLPLRWRQVLVRHYGLADTPPQTFAAIGRTWGVSRQRVHQLHTAALVALAHPARSLPLRQLVARHERAAYQQALARQRQWARARRAPRRGRR
jgi:RNA polymerase sigma factor (sigma-70 family)